MAVETTDKPSKEAMRAGMKVFFGEHGDKGIELEDAPAPETAPIVDKPPKEGEVGPDGKPVEKAPETPPPAPEPEAKPKRVTKKKPVEAPPAPPARVDSDTITRVASETAARTAAEMQKKDKSDDAPPVDKSLDGVELLPTEQRFLARLKMAGEVNDKLKDAHNRQVKFYSEAQKYRTQWEAKHPGTAFDPDDEQHKEWYDAHEPEFDRGEIEDGVIEFREKKLKAELKAEAEGRLNQVEQKRSFETRWKEEAPIIDKAANESVAELVADVDPELAKLLSVDGETSVSAATFDKIEAKDKIAGRVLKRNATHFARAIVEVERLERFQGYYYFDKQHNEVHQQIDKAVNEMEHSILALPKEDQLYDPDNGDNRTFMRGHEYWGKASEIHKSNKTPEQKEAAWNELNSKHWSLEKEDVKDAVKRLFLRVVKEKISEDREIVANYLKSNETPAPEIAPPTTATTSQEPAPSRPKPPSTPSGGGDKTSTTIPAPATSGNMQERVDAAFFR